MSQREGYGIWHNTVQPKSELELFDNKIDWYIKACAAQAEEITVLKQRLAEMEKDFSILEQNYDAAFSRVKELEQALRDMRNWIDGDTRAINRDVGIGNCSFNDVYESLDKLDAIANKALGDK